MPLSDGDRCWEVIPIEYHPKKHQQLAEAFCMERPRAALFLDMGLGPAKRSSR